MARITLAKIRANTIRSVGLKAVLDGVAAGRTYDEICQDINTLCFAGENIARARRRYHWAFIKCSHEDGTDVCPPPPLKSATAKVEAVEAVASTEITPVVDGKAILATVIAEMKNLADDGDDKEGNEVALSASLASLQEAAYE